MRYALAVLVLLSATANAQQATTPTDTVPELTISRSENGTLAEYRFDERLFMVEVRPDKGPAYFMLDSNGDGRLDERRHEIDGLQIPGWLLDSPP